MAATVHNLPGLYFQVVPTEPETVLPRMDIAAFVGLASSGPLHTPVAVEDPLRFRDIFGPDLSLAWDSERGKMQESYLGQAVEAFFRNGGRRCWVVRVAGNSSCANRFQVPGLVHADSLRPAAARARSEGSWSDSLRVGAVQVSDALGLTDFEADGHGRIFAYNADVLATPLQLAARDLVRLTFSGSELVLFLPVQSVVAEASLQRIRAAKGYWFLRHHTGSLVPLPKRVVLLAHEGESELPGPIDLHLPLVAPTPYMLDVGLPMAQVPEPGELLRVDLEDDRTLLLPVSRVEPVVVGGSPVEDGLRIYANEGYWPLEQETGVERYREWATSGSPAPVPLAERLTMELWVWRNRELFGRMPDLALAGGHPRSWTGLPIDAEAFRLQIGPRQTWLTPVALEALEFPRFPLAGPERAEASAAKARNTLDELYLPLGMPFRPDPDISQGPVGDPSSQTRLERNGLGTFCSDLFLDKQLTHLGVNTLLAGANHRLYVLGEPLYGIYSLLPLEEVTLVSVPDAIHYAWRDSPSLLPEVLLAPVLHRVVPLKQPGKYRVCWERVDAATSYLLQEAREPTFSEPVTRYQGPECETTLDIESDCPQSSYYRVRAQRNGELSPWSNTQLANLPEPEFDACAQLLLDAPILALEVPDAGDQGTVELVWDKVEGAVDYEVQEAPDPSMESARTLLVGEQTSLRRTRRLDRITYFRVRALRNNDTSPWSDTKWDVTVAPTRPVQDVYYDDSSLLDVQRALLRLCAARGDLFALLALPAHYDESLALAHATALGWRFGGNGQPPRASGIVSPLNTGEVAALSYGALYHPWLWARLEGKMGTADTRLVPPEGAVCGTYAARALVRGAWIAPANEPLSDVVALQPAIDRSGWSVLFRGQINIIRQDPRGFMVLSADTLSPEASLKPINVRRLLVLLRRLALREGTRYVFQNNDADFRRFVHYQFDRLLADLYARGAFAGATPDQAYQVVVDERVNTRQQTEQGRLIVELRVAPSRPTAYITIRLVQTGYDGLSVEEL